MENLELYWLRHGTAEDKKPGQSDAERHLTEEGIEEIRYVAKCLKRLNLEIDFVFTSPLVRAVQTAERAAEVLGLEENVHVCEGLLPEDHWEILRDALLGHMPFSRALLVGHQPSFGQMIGRLICPGSGLEIPLKKAGLCRVDVDGLGKNPQGELVWLLNPKILKKITKVKNRS